MAQGYDMPSNGYAIVDMGAAKGTGAREDYENDVYMRKAAEKLNKRDRQAMKITAQDQNKKYSKKTSDKKSKKRISTKK